MNTVTATELSRNLQDVADRVNTVGEPLVVIKNSKPLFRVVPLKSEVAQGLDELRKSNGSSDAMIFDTPEKAIDALSSLA
jgi:prevent-host-death family protein